MPAFDTKGFLLALERNASARSKTMKDVAAETGVSETTISRMRAGTRMCDAASLAALSAWAGINPARYSAVRPRRSSTAVPQVRLRAEQGVSREPSRVVAQFSCGAASDALHRGMRRPGCGIV